MEQKQSKQSENTTENADKNVVVVGESTNNVRPVGLLPENENQKNNNFVAEKSQSENEIEVGEQVKRFNTEKGEKKLVQNQVDYVNSVNEVNEITLLQQPTEDNGNNEIEEENEKEDSNSNSNNNDASKANRNSKNKAKKPKKKNPPKPKEENLIPAIPKTLDEAVDMYFAPHIHISKPNSNKKKTTTKESAVSL